MNTVLTADASCLLITDCIYFHIPIKPAKHSELLNEQAQSQGARLIFASYSLPFK